MFRVSQRSEIQADKTRIEKELWEAMTRQEIRYRKKHFFLRFYYEKCSDILKKNWKNCTGKIHTPNTLDVICLYNLGILMPVRMVSSGFNCINFSNDYFFRCWAFFTCSYFLFECFWYEICPFLFPFLNLAVCLIKL